MDAEAREERIRWGVPDWRDAAEYPAAAWAGYGVLAWEFLRRDCAYREAWVDLKATGELRSPEQFHVPLSCDLDPAAPGWEKTQNGVSINGSIMSALGDGFPSHADWRTRRVQPPRENQIQITFDLTENIEQQLRMAQRLLEVRQSDAGLVNPKVPKIRSDLLPLYLRVFDARRAGCTAREIAAELHPRDHADEEALLSHVARYEKQFKVADELVRGGWARIAAIAHYVRKKGS